MVKFIVFLCLLALAMPAVCATPANQMGGPDGFVKKEAIQSEIPYKQGESITAALVIRVVVSLVVVLALTLVGVFFLKRYFPGYSTAGGKSSQHITVLEVKRLTPKTLLFLLEIDGKTLLVAQSGDRVTTLAIGEKTPSQPDIPSRGD